MSILSRLIKQKIVTKEQVSKLEADAKAASVSPEELAISENVVDEETIFSAKAEEIKLPLRKVGTTAIPLEVLALIPADSAKYYRMVPLSFKDNKLEVGMVEPENVEAEQALKFLARQGNFSYVRALVTPSTFDAVFAGYRSTKQETREVLEELEKDIEVEKPTAKEGAMQRVVEEAPVTKMVAVILRTAVEGGASDIHVEPIKDKLRIRFRSLGELHSSLFLPADVHQTIVARIKILAKLKIDESRTPQDGRFSAIIDKKSVDFRVSTFPTALGEKVAIRVLDPTRGLKGLEDLGLEGTNLAKVKKALKKPFGLVLSTGPTGSGKTTTLYSMLNSLNREGVNIVSLEDPVEYLIPGVNQSQIRPELGYDFAQGLRQVLRQDPDIIMVGEVRDSETASLVTHAALTGHIVLSTLHTNNAEGVIVRLLNMGVDKYLIPPTLSVALAQRLVRRLCDACHEAAPASKEVEELIRKELQSAPSSLQKQLTPYLSRSEGLQVYQAKGCKKCGGSGYSGRIGIFEVLEMTPELSAIILSEPTGVRIAEELKRQGMVTMAQDGFAKVLEGVTTAEEILQVTVE